MKEYLYRGKLACVCINNICCATLLVQLYMYHFAFSIQTVTRTIEQYLATENTIAIDQEQSGRPNCWVGTITLQLKINR